MAKKIESGAELLVTELLAKVQKVVVGIWSWDADWGVGDKQDRQQLRDKIRAMQDLLRTMGGKHSDRFYGYEFSDIGQAAAAFQQLQNDPDVATCEIIFSKPGPATRPGPTTCELKVGYRPAKPPKWSKRKKKK